MYTEHACSCTRGAHLQPSLWVAASKAVSSGAASAESRMTLLPLLGGGLTSRPPLAGSNGQPRSGRSGNLCMRLKSQPAAALQGCSEALHLLLGFCSAVACQASSPSGHTIA